MPLSFKEKNSFQTKYLWSPFEHCLFQRSFSLVHVSESIEMKSLTKAVLPMAFCLYIQMHCQWAFDYSWVQKYMCDVQSSVDDKSAK